MVRDIIIIVSSVIVAVAAWDILGRYVRAPGPKATRIIAVVIGVLAYWRLG